jgi:hypothetical protein
VRIGLLATLPLLAAVLAGCTSTPPAPAPGATPGPTAAPAGPDPDGGGTGTVMTDPAQGYRPAHELKFDGPATGMVTVGRVDCSRVGPDTYSWVLAADLSGTPLQLKFDTNRYRGAGSYQLSGSGSVLTMKFGDRTAATDSSHTGTFTVDEDSETGSIEATLGTSGGQQKITGPWSCTGE